MRILTVLRTGGEYKPEHVERLAVQCEKFAPGVEFRCISDVPVPNRIKMHHDWPGWWAKLEMFRLRGPCFYLDLDTTIVAGLSPVLAAFEKFTVLRDFNSSSRDMGSGLMAWRGDMRALYRAFAADPAKHVAENNSARWWGDQGFIERRTSKRTYWQDLLPGAVVSWKKHCGNGVPEGARIICFHGRPKPWDIE